MSEEEEAQTQEPGKLCRGIVEDSQTITQEEPKAGGEMSRDGFCKSGQQAIRGCQIRKGRQGKRPGVQSNE